MNGNKSHCDNDSAVIAIEDFLPGWMLQLIFTRTADMFSLDRVVLDFNLTNPVDFPAANTTAKQVITTSGVNSWKTHNGRAFKCDLVSQWTLNTTDAKGVQNIYLSMDHIHAEAFVVNGTVGQDEVCGSGDNDTSEIVPIAVGCALAALVVIVLIAYVIGRRRNRARGYESM